MNAEELLLWEAQIILKNDYQIEYLIKQKVINQNGFYKFYNFLLITYRKVKELEPNNNIKKPTFENTVKIYKNIGKYD